MTSNLDTATSAGDRARARAYLVDFLPGIIGYTLVLIAVLTWGHLDGTSGWRYLWALLPVLPTLWVIRAVWRHFGRIDDYQRMVLLRSLSGGFAIAMVGALTLGLLASAGLPATPAGICWIVFGVGMAGWGISSVVAARR